MTEEELAAYDAKACLLGGIYHRGTHTYRFYIREGKYAGCAEYSYLNADTLEHVITQSEVISNTPYGYRAKHNGQYGFKAKPYLINRV